LTPARERLARAALAVVTFTAAAWLRTAGAQELVFASAAEASAVLGARDAFVERMSPFDRAARLKTGREVTEREYLAFARAAALDWNDAEKRAVNDAFRAIERELHALELPLPKRVLMVKTTGAEEGNTAYTRAQAIVLPQRMVDDPRDLARTLAHELFHIASRTQPGFADALYATIGFHRCGEPAYPPELAPRKITNPDAPRNDYCIAVTVDGAKLQVTPILYSRAAQYDAARGGEFFDYLQLGFLAVPASDREGVLGIDKLSGFVEQIGQNTQYVIHPEEILADNFSLLATGRTQVPSPEVLDRIKRALADFD
jgi:hypothetical protein